MLGIFPCDADQMAEAGVDGDGLHSGANRDAFVQYVEKRIEPFGFARFLAAAAKQRVGAQPECAERRQSDKSRAGDKAGRSCRRGYVRGDRTSRQQYNRAESDDDPCSRAKAGAKPKGCARSPVAQFAPVVWRSFHPWSS